MSIGREYAHGSAIMSFGKQSLATSLARMPWGFVAIIAGIAIFGTARTKPIYPTNIFTGLRLASL